METIRPRQRLDLSDPTMTSAAEKIVLELRACPRHVTGRLVDDSRRPLSGVTISSVVRVDEFALAPIGRSAIDGTFSVCSPGSTAAGGGDLGLAMFPPVDDVGDIVLIPTMAVR